MKNKFAYNDNLPHQCYAVKESDGSVIGIRNGERGFYQIDKNWVEGKKLQNGFTTNQQLVDHVNEMFGVSPQEREALAIGSLFGFQVPGCNVNRFHTDGREKNAEELEKEGLL